MIPFFSSDRTGIVSLVQMQFAELAVQVKEQGHSLSWTPAVVDAFAALCMDDHRRGGGMRACVKYVEVQVEQLLQEFLDTKEDNAACSMVLFRDITPEDDYPIQVVTSSKGCGTTKSNKKPEKEPSKPSNKKSSKNPKKKSSKNPKQESQRQSGNKMHQRELDEAQDILHETDHENDFLKRFKLLLSKTVETVKEISQKHLSEEERAWLHRAAIVACIVAICVAPALQSLLALGTLILLIWDFLPEWLQNILLWIWENPIIIPFILILLWFLRREMKKRNQKNQKDHKMDFGKNDWGFQKNQKDHKMDFGKND